MVIQRNCEFVTNSNSPIVSKIFSNSTGDILTLQISGANGEYYLEGRNNSKLDWIAMGGINLSDFSAVKGKFTKAGMYEIGIAGARELRVRVNSTEGNVSIFGQIISLEET